MPDPSDLLEKVRSISPDEILDGIRFCHRHQHECEVHAGKIFPKKRSLPQ